MELIILLIILNKRNQIIIIITFLLATLCKTKITCIEISVKPPQHSQRCAPATFDSGDDFSNQPTQANDNYDNFDQTIMDLEVHK